MSSRRDSLRAELLTAFNGAPGGTAPWVLALAVAGSALDSGPRAADYALQRIRRLRG